MHMLDMLSAAGHWHVDHLAALQYSACAVMTQPIMTAGRIHAVCMPDLQHMIAAETLHCISRRFMLR